MGSSRLRRAALQLGLAVCALGISLLIFEGMVRVFVPVSDFFWQPDPVLGSRLVPNKEGRFVRRGQFDVPVAINSHGFRDREHGHAKPAGTTRVLLLGNSTVEALQVPFEKSITAVLEARLRQGGLNAEAINLGNSGFGTGREYLMLREHGLKYDPDVVLLFFVSNDLAHNSVRLEGIPYLPYPILAQDGSLARDSQNRPRFTRPALSPRSRNSWSATIKEHSKGYRLLRVTVTESPVLHAIAFKLGALSEPPPEDDLGARSLGMFEMYRTPMTPAWAEALSTTEQLLAETAELAHAHRARFAVVLVPMAWEVYPARWSALRARVPALNGPDLDLMNVSRRITDFLARRQISCVNLLPAFREAGGTSPALYFSEDPHWAADGHRLAAQVAARAVQTTLAVGDIRPCEGTAPVKG